jgi:hypothetical protein
VISDPAFSSRLRALLGEACPFVGVIGFDEGPAVLAPMAGEATPIHDVRQLPETAVETAEPLQGTVVLVARTLADLAQCSFYSAFLPMGRHFYIEVAQMAEPSRPTSIELPPTRPWRTMTEQRIRRDRTGHWSIETVLDQPADLASLVRACTAHRAPRSRPLVPRVGVVGPSTQWAAGTSGYAIAPLRTGEPDSGSEAYPAADVVLHSVPAATVPTWGGHPRLIERRTGAPTRPFSLFPDHREPLHDEPLLQDLPPVDEHLVNPIGFRWDTGGEHPVMSFDGRGWSVYPPTSAPFLLPASGVVTDTEIERCRPFRSVAIDWDSHPGDPAGAAAVAALAAAGIPLVSHGPVPRWALALGEDLCDRIGKYETRDLDDPLLRELHSVRLRRAALAEHGSAGRRHALAGPPTGFGADDTVSVILCTRRPTFLSSAFAQIAAQRHDRLELVLVLHGVTADDPEIRDAVAEVRVPLRIVEAPASDSFGDALNAGVAAATGKYLTKFDDDDWYGPHHVPDLLLAARYSGADLIGTQPEFVHLESPDLTIHKRPGPSERFTVHVSGATMLIRREDLLELGGYRPLRTSEDRALLQDVQRGGGTVYCTHGLNFLISRRSWGHTWNAPVASFLRNSARQWRGVDLGPTIAADTLEDHLQAQKGTVAPR